MESECNIFMKKQARVPTGIIKEKLGDFADETGATRKFIPWSNIVFWIPGELNERIRCFSKYVLYNTFFMDLANIVT